MCRRRLKVSSNTQTRENSKVRRALAFKVLSIIWFLQWFLGALEIILVLPEKKKIKLNRTLL